MTGCTPFDVLRHTLGNGLRVVIDTGGPSSLTAIAVHYRVGHRSETPEYAGFAHLFEHLMFQGSAHLPHGEYYAELKALGYLARGTTHQDYTDYFHVLPAHLLDRAVFNEADRMRAPRFTPGGLAEQLAAVETEISGAVHESPLGGFPWPLLAGVLYDSFANSHDGYGDVRALRDITPEQCAEFFEAYYTPGNAVLTISGDHDPDEVMRLVERHFGGIGPRLCAPSAALTEPTPDADRVRVRRVRGGGPTVVAVGYRLPDPAEDLGGYLSHMIIARLLAAPPSAERSPIADAGCGFFAPLDALDPDTMVIILRAPERGGPDSALRDLDRRLDAIAEEATPSWRRAGADLVCGHYRTNHDPASRARGLGRLEALFHRPGLLDEIPARLSEINGGEVAAAARRLRAAHRAVLIMEPGERPVARPADGSPRGTRPSPTVDRVTPGPGSTSVAGPRPALVLGAHAENASAVLVHDDRTPLVEIRWRFPVRRGAELIEAFLLADVLAQRWPEDTAPTVTVEGAWFGLDTAVSGTTDWPAILGDIARRPLTGAEVTAAAPRAAARMRLAVADPGWLFDQAALRLPGVAPRAATPPEPLEGRRFPPGVLSAVGDLDPAPCVRRLGEVLPQRSRAGSPVVPRADDERLARMSTPGPSRIRWSAAEPPRRGDTTEVAARHLAVTVLGGGHPQARLTGLGLHGLSATVHAGLDCSAGVSRVLVAAEQVEGDPVTAALRIRREMRRFEQAPPSAGEVAAAKELCSGRFLSVLQSQSTLADHLIYWTRQGMGVEALDGFTEVLEKTSRENIHRACVELFSRPGFVGLIAGPLDPETKGAADVGGSDETPVQAAQPGGRS